LNDVEGELRQALLGALSLKDQAELVRRAERGGLSAERVKQLALLSELHGDEAVFARARSGQPKSVEPALVELEALYRSVSDAGLGRAVVLDLGETSQVGYYTGCTFQILAEGPGQAVASGGRYDELLSAFHLQLPAAGAAIHVDHLRWALGDERSTETSRALVVSGPGASEASVEATLEALRAAGIPSVVAVSEPALDYARAWRYSHLVRLADDGSMRLSRVGETSEEDLGAMPLGRAVETMRS
jgi:ATP phosphoribosyltransferase regulatory subunit